METLPMTKTDDQPTRVKAQLQADGTCELSVSVSAPYGEGNDIRTATATVTDFSEELKAKAQALLEEIRMAGYAQAQRQARRDAGQAELVAVNRKEME